MSFLSSILQVAMGVLMIFGKQLAGVEQYTRQIYGGYTLYSKICVGAVEVSGVMYSFQTEVFGFLTKIERQLEIRRLAAVAQIVVE